MEMLFVIGGIGLAVATTIVGVVVRARRRRTESQARAAGVREAQRREAEEAQHRSDVAARAAAQRERQAEEEAHRRAAEETQRSAEQEARIATVREAQRRAEESARAAAEAERQRQAEEEARRAEEEARAEREAQRQVEVAQRRAEEEAPVATEREAQRLAEEEARAAAAERQRNAEEEARVAAEREAQRQADEIGAAARPEAPPLPAQRAPRQYRPTTRAATSLRASASPSRDRVARDRAMPIEVRLVFEKAGFCRVSLLPRRAAEMPAEFAVEGSGCPPALQALQDEWYQDVMLPDIGRLLSKGIEWAGALPGGAAGRLSLSGRSIFVLSRHGELSGFVSTPRLVLGEEHVVLCVAERLPDVRAAIALTESPEPTELNSDSGMPSGWIGLRGVCPKKPVAPSPGGDIIDALRPLPDVEIALIGGIRVDRQTWLIGFPPTVELLGDASTLGVVTIDGQEATRSSEGGYVAPGWDSAGEHTVWCTSTSRTYAIRSGAERWEPWDAYAWSLGEPTAAGTQSRPGICGVLVRPPRVARADSRPTVVAASNPILIGARPGEIEVCTPRGDVRAGLCVGFPWFEPIWAIPADALHCDKRTARVILIGAPVVVDGGDEQSIMHGGRAARSRDLACGSHAWCSAILAAGRKGLQTEPSRVEIADLWKDYRHYAKALRRRGR